MPEQDQNQRPSIDFGPELADLATLFQDVVTDTTDPVFLGFLTELATDSVEIGAMRANGADPALIQRAQDAVAARAQSLAQTPGLVVAASLPSFMDVVNRVIRTGSNFLAGVLRYYMPIAPLPTA